MENPQGLGYLCMTSPSRPRKCLVLCLSLPMGGEPHEGRTGPVSPPLCPQHCSGHRAGAQGVCGMNWCQAVECGLYPKGAGEPQEGSIREVSRLICDLETPGYLYSRPRISTLLSTGTSAIKLLFVSSSSPSPPPLLFFPPFLLLFPLLLPSTGSFPRTSGWFQGPALCSHSPLALPS